MPDVYYATEAEDEEEVKSYLDRAYEMAQDEHPDLEVKGHDVVRSAGITWIVVHMGDPLPDWMREEP